MSTTTQTSNGSGTVTATAPAKLEVVTLPVADVDRAKAFYQGLGWRFDIDFEPAPGVRGVQFTPPGSPASIQFGSGSTTMKEPLQGLILVVDDIEAAREDLIGRGADVSEIWYAVPGEGRHTGVDPQHRSYASRAIFSDPDGNQWQLQEVGERLPGRVDPTDVEALAQLLLETATHHGAFEAIAPAHDWWNWYAPYFDARQNGTTPDEADAIADLYMKEAHGVVVSR